MEVFAVSVLTFGTNSLLAGVQARAKEELLRKDPPIWKERERNVTRI